MTIRNPLTCPIGFNAQHSPMGAFMSFTCGHPGTRGGIGLQIGHPAEQDMYIGYIEGDRFSDKPLKALPFYAGADSSAAEAYLVEQAGPAEQNAKADVEPIDLKDIRRCYSWGTDCWHSGPMSFSIYTPFADIPDPAKTTHSVMRRRLLPGILAQLTIDNTNCKTPKTGVFSLGFPNPGTRPIHADLGADNRVGFALRRGAGFAAEVCDITFGASDVRMQPYGFMRWSPTEGLREKYNPIHLLGTCPGLAFEVPAGMRYRMTIAIGCYLEHYQTSGLDGMYLYTRYYQGLNDVLRSALNHSHEFITEAEARSKVLDDSPLSADQKFMIAHATHSYYGSTQLLETGGAPLWVVNEGEYCMMNTLDLAVDHVFWELDHNPWVVRNLLDTFATRYRYTDEIKIYRNGKVTADPSNPADPSCPPIPPDAAQLARPYDTVPGGISFCHDMGAHNNFSAPGTSSYELANLTGCFSYMTLEELCNWILTAGCYMAKTRDTEWLKQQQPIIDACLKSMINRGGEAGFAQHDSAKCGGGQEITTYDSLDHSLAQTRNNAYMAVKCWASYRALGLMFRDLGESDAQTSCDEHADRIAEVVIRQEVGGVLPAIFEKDSPGYHSHILPAVEGCIYAMYFAETGYAGCKVREMFASVNEDRMFTVLKEHARKLLTDPERKNLFPDGGIKLSSTSDNSWMSKICIFMHIARKLFMLDEDPEIAGILNKADAAHVVWQAKGSAYWACCDQIVAGVAKASRYYPRIVTSALWMH